MLGNIQISTEVSVSNVRNPTYENVRTPSNISPFGPNEVRDTILIKSDYNRIQMDRSDMQVLKTQTQVTEIPQETTTTSRIIQSQYVPQMQQS
jgi:hypothetical protein